MDKSQDPTAQKPNSNPESALQSEIAAVRAQQANSSWLRKGIDLVTEPYHRQASALNNLTATADQIAHQANSDRNQEIADKAITRMEASRRSELDAYKITSNLVKTAAAFAPDGLGHYTAGSIYLLDTLGAKGTNAGDAVMAFTQGALMHKLAGRVMKGDANPAMMSLRFGVSSRIIDTALTRTNYINQANGEASWSSFGQGLTNIGQNALNPISVATDIATAGLAHGLTKLAPATLTANTFRTLTTTTFTRGYANGMAQELQDEHRTGQYSAERLALFPMAMGLSTALGAAPGNQTIQVRNWPLENAATIRDLDYKLVSLKSSDINAIARSGSKPIDITVRPVGEDFVLGAPENLAISRAKIPTDWIAAMLQGSAKKAASKQEEWRFLSRPKGDDATPWTMATNRGTTPLFQLMNESSGDFYQGRQMPRSVENLTEPATKFLGSGSQSGAFMLANGAVLKLSSLALGWPEKTVDWGKLPYDSRIMFGPILFGKSARAWDRDTVGTAKGLLLQEPLKTPVTQAQAEALREDMKKSNIDFHDFDGKFQGETKARGVDQTGLDANGQSVVIDYGARRDMKDQYESNFQPLKMPKLSKPSD